MNKENENIKLMPELRFAEFDKDGEWRLETVDNLSETVTAGGTPSTKKDEYWGGNIRWINSGELNLKIVREVEGRITDKGLKNSSTKIIPVNCVLIGLAGQGKTRGTVATNKVELCINQSIASIFPNDEVFDSSYLYHNLDNRYNELRELSAGGQGRGGLNLKIIKEINIPIPPEITEQQKIAATLTSLDELIAVENEKLEALQAHKKGLLQQLFPGKGEKVTKVRFGEFSGEWELKKFSNYINLYRGSSPRPIKKYLTTDEDGVNWIKIGDTKSVDNFILPNVSEKITSKGAEKSRKVNEGELILANSMSYGATYQLDLAGCIYDAWFVLREFESFFDKQFLLQLLNSNYMQIQYKRLAAGGIVQNISSEIVYNTILPRPSISEQQKIAATLFSLDDALTAQSDKIKTLNEHKDGLMQKMFPNINSKKL